jgi:hypothetical protein
MASPSRRTFFVESYVPALDEATAAALSSRLREAVDELRLEGRTLEWLRSFVLVDEETYVWMLAAADVDDVALVNERARVRYDHVAEVVAGEHFPSQERAPRRRDLWAIRRHVPGCETPWGVSP